MMMSQLGSLFFAPLDAYPAAGMFTTPHLISLVVCLIILLVALKASLKKSWEQVMKLTRVIAIVVTILEGVKIAYNFYYGYTWLDAWFPLSFCSLFIYATWFSGFGKGTIKKVGDAFIVMGCLLGGIGFLLLPTTSLMRYPIWHFLCLYSLLFHMLMIYLSVLYLWHRCVPINRYTYVYFSVYFLISALICIGLNTIYDSNLMILREPYNVPFKFIQEIKAQSQMAYTCLATLAYLIGPGLFALGTSGWLKEKKVNNQTSDFSY